MCEARSPRTSLRVFDGVEALLAEGERSPCAEGSVVTIGNFDGVHKGHQALIRHAREEADRRGTACAVLTFEPHPLAVLKPELKVRRLFDAEDRRTQMAGLGVDALVVQPFSREFSQLSPDRFLAEVLLRPFRPKLVVVGYDFNFGAGRAGSIDSLKEKASTHGFEVSVLPPVSVNIGEEMNNTVVSSTKIRTALANGEVEAASLLLGRPYTLRGPVIKGAGRGRTIGIPTANVQPSVEPMLKLGVYAGFASLRGDRYKVVVNVGRNPTFVDSQTVHVEAHFLDFVGEIYGERVELHFHHRLRDEMKFPSAAALVAQIGQDIDDAKGRLG